MTRTPLQPLNEELRQKLARERQPLTHRDVDNLPLNLTDAERRAALGPGLPARPKEKQMTPLVPEKYASLAVAIATALAGAAALAPKLAFLPPWAPFAIWCLAGVAAYLAGKALPEFQGVPPALPLWLVPILKSVAAVLTGYAASLPPGTITQSLVMLAAVFVGALAGKAEPQALKTPSFLPPPTKG